MTTYYRSDGPDRLKNKYACRIYHEGTRTFESYKSPSGRYMLSDIDCCCDPCNHERSNYEHTLCHDGTDEDSTDSGCLCCSCSPHMIMATWEGDHPGDPCSINSFVEPMFLHTDTHDTDYDNHWSTAYVGNLVGRNISAYISNYEIGETGKFLSDDGSGCRWTLLVAGTGATEPATSVTGFIDHTETTCLSVPTNVSISGVIPTHGGSGGTITFHNYFGSKVPFQRRTDETGIYPNQLWPIHPIHAISGGNQVQTVPGLATPVETFSPPQTGLSITLPSGRITPPFFQAGFDAPNTTPTGGSWINGCTHTGVVYPTGVSGIPRKSLCDEVPRFLCVETAGLGSTYGQEFREFEFDTGYYPIHRMEFHPSYTGIEYFTTGTVLCRWTYTPLNYEHSGTEAPITNPTQAWHNPARDKYKKYVFLYETFVDATAEFSGNMDAVANSGSPKYALIPAMNLDPLPVGNSEFEMRGVGSQSGFLSPQNTVGSAFIAHSGIHYLYDFPINTLKEQGEQFYWTSGTHTKTPWLGGIDYTLSSTASKAGDGTSCPCDLRAATSYMIGSSPTRISIKPGKCSCWGYYCSDRCRCVPKELCLFSIEFDKNGNQTVITDNLVWNTGNLAWEAGYSGIDLFLQRSTNGFKTGGGKETYTPACVTPTFADQSGYYVDKGYSLTESSDRERTVHCSYNDMEFEFSDIKRNAGGDVESGVAVYLFPNFLTGNCNFKTACDEASPCETGCNKHPENLNLNLYGYGVVDEDECEDDNNCGDTIGPIDIPLRYNQRITLLGTTPPSLETACWYEGFTTCDDFQVQVKWVGGSVGNAGLTIIQTGISFGEPGAPTYLYSATADSPGWMVPLSGTQTCEPYYVSGTWRDGGAPLSIDWNCDEATVYRWNMVITEV